MRHYYGLSSTQDKKAFVEELNKRNESTAEKNRQLTQKLLDKICELSQTTGIPVRELRKEFKV
jgi:hypothetical protein